MSSQKGWTFGYVRVSTADQNVARQMDVMKGIDPDNIYVDEESGAKREREELDRLLKIVRRGDTVRVKSPDRLARNTIDLLEIANDLHERGVSLEFVDAPMLNVDSAQGEFMLTIYGAFAQLEREMIRERQAEGIAIAKKEGKYAKEAKLTPEQVAEARERIDAGVSKAQVARDLEVSRPTLYDALAGRGIYGSEEYRESGNTS